MSELERPAVKRVRNALVTSGIGDNALNLETSARSAQAAAALLLNVYATLSLHLGLVTMY